MGRVVIFSVISHFESNEGDAETPRTKDETDRTGTLSIALKQAKYLLLPVHANALENLLLIYWLGFFRYRNLPAKG